MEIGAYIQDVSNRFAGSEFYFVNERRNFINTCEEVGWLGVFIICGEAGVGVANFQN